jgi:hypothetical protein
MSTKCQTRTLIIREQLTKKLNYLVLSEEHAWKEILKILQSSPVSQPITRAGSAVLHHISVCIWAGHYLGNSRSWHAWATLGFYLGNSRSWHAWATLGYYLDNSRSWHAWATLGYYLDNSRSWHAWATLGYYLNNSWSWHAWATLGYYLENSRFLLVWHLTTVWRK